MEWTEGFEVREQNGLAFATVSPRAACGLCGGSGRREVEVGGVRRVGRCRCQRLPDRVALFNAARIPARHGHCTMESFRVTIDGAKPGWQATRRWLDRYAPGQDNNGLVLYGAPGRGKTHLLVAAIRELIFRHGVEARFVEFTHLISSIKEGFDRKDGESTTLSPLARVPVLAVDELGKGRRTDFELSIIDEIVTRRYNGRGTLLGTTNFPLSAPPRTRSEDPSLATERIESLAERLGERVFSRLAESVQFAPTLGEDFRVTRGR